MIELRWVNRLVNYPVSSMETFVPIGEPKKLVKVLQYREFDPTHVEHEQFGRSGVHAKIGKWSEWKDVPEVEE